MAPPPSVPSTVQPPRMFGMPPPPLPNQSIATIGQTGAPVAGSSKIDPNQIPRPLPSSSVTVHATRQGNQANSPPVIIQSLSFKKKLLLCCENLVSSHIFLLSINLL